MIAGRPAAAAAAADAADRAAATAAAVVASSGDIVWSLPLRYCISSLAIDIMVAEGLTAEVGAADASGTRRVEFAAVLLCAMLLLWCGGQDYCVMKQKKNWRGWRSCGGCVCLPESKRNVAKERLGSRLGSRLRSGESHE